MAPPAFCISANNVRDVPLYSFSFFSLYPFPFSRATYTRTHLTWQLLNLILWLKDGCQPCTGEIVHATAAHPNRPGNIKGFELKEVKVEADKTDLVVGRGHMQKEATFAEDVPRIAEVPTEAVEESDEMDDFEDSSAVDFDDFEGRLDQMGRDHGST